MTMLRRILLLVLAPLLVPVHARAQDKVEYYHVDAVGSVRAVTDTTGTTAVRHDFFPFGEEYMETPPTNDVKRFVGKEREVETGLDYFGARYYGRRVARFTTVDPVVAWSAALQDPQQWNRYAYARNNPLRFTDPDGRCIWDLCAAEGTGAYLVGAAAVATTAWLVSPPGREAVSQVANDTRTMITTAAGAIESWFQSAEAKRLPERAGPAGHISPSEVINKTPDQIDKRARELGLLPKGPDPANGRGSYVDPVTGEQRILSHPNDPKGPHGHVNNPAGERVGPNGRIVAPESKDAHLPIKKEQR